MKLSKKFNKMSLQVQEAYLVKELQEMYIQEDAIKTNAR